MAGSQERPSCGSHCGLGLLASAACGGRTTPILKLHLKQTGHDGIAALQLIEKRSRAWVRSSDETKPDQEKKLNS